MKKRVFSQKALPASFFIVNFEQIQHIIRSACETCIYLWK